MPIIRYKRAPRLAQQHQLILQHHLSNNMKVFIISALVAVAVAAPNNPAPYAPAPYGAEPAYPDAAPVYNYAYAVADDYSGANFGANEGRDGYATNGEYHVALPDGRIQTVTYSVADAYGGYVADVKYSGEPTYAPAPAPYKPAPAPYAPAPAPYRPAPAPYAPAPYRPAPYHA